MRDLVLGFVAVMTVFKVFSNSVCVDAWGLGNSGSVILKVSYACFLLV